MKAGDWVRTREPLMGFAQGPSVEHGDGAPREIPAGAPCQVFSVERSTGWVSIHDDLDFGGSFDPYRVEAIIEPEMLTAATRPELRPMIPEGTPEHR
jgi:hypothetical protein